MYSHVEGKNHHHHTRENIAAVTHYGDWIQVLSVYPVTHDTQMDRHQIRIQYLHVYIAFITNVGLMCIYSVGCTRHNAHDCPEITGKCSHYKIYCLYQSASDFKCI